MPRSAALLLAHGTPETVEEIPAYLRNVTGGRPLPEAVVKEIQRRYSLIGRSPLTEITLRQAEMVAAEAGLPTYVGMRNWKPWIADAVKQMAQDGVTEAVAVCLAPHNSRTSVGLYRNAILGEGQTLPFRLAFVESWYDHPLLIAAFAEKLRSGWRRACEEAGSKLPVIFTAHSVPQRTITEGDPYEAQARQTASLVAAAVPEITDWRFAFQSQGMSGGGAWLGPTAEETIAALAEAGHKGVFLQPIGFVCDHVEILYDIDILFRQVAEAKGMRLWRADSLNDSPLLAKAVADVARKNLPGAQR